jgi:hypothetical protein
MKIIHSAMLSQFLSPPLELWLVIVERILQLQAYALSQSPQLSISYLH